MFFQKYLLSYGTEHHQFFDLLERMLEYEPLNRISPSSVLCHPFFLPVIHPRRSQIWRNSCDMSRWPWIARTSSHTILLVSFSTDHVHVCFMLHFSQDMLIERALYWYVKIKTLFIVDLKTKYEKIVIELLLSLIIIRHYCIFKTKTISTAVLHFLFRERKQSKFSWTTQKKTLCVTHGTDWSLNTETMGSTEESSGKTLLTWHRGSFMSWQQLCQQWLFEHFWEGPENGTGQRTTKQWFAKLFSSNLNIHE